ncbi:uncharacterized protein BDR25DRAFT_292449 [Lindgomyces ingoldianus]|uniref:Uncharacterized protein n=1 Tax=Lindgomyces ingoldianus TaxID=673940 RepID=A0ACB6QJZ6_9PLEO|nr:uncharacterized protein BDR25DRAFT_292449 [Lindgomyces ingoldianus]KAF2467323.1 hypothetical protein BDR25DRAFT_292449 [Lindgomyces ingoldianus]
MHPPSIVSDALWKCLCPSFQPGPALCRLSRGRLQRAIQSVPPKRSLGPASPTAQLRAYTTAVGRQTSAPGISHGFDRSIGSSSARKPSLVHLPTPELYERLRSDAAAGRHAEVMNIIKILLKDRRERPNVVLYASILHSFVSPEDGTAGKIRKILDDMGEDGIELDATTCHFVLEALAVHPDYLLRSEILEYMKDRWLTLTDKGHNFVIAGLLRDRLFEQALEKIDDMVQQRIPVAPWLYDTAMYMLLDYGEVEEAHQLLLLRQSSGLGNLSYTLWMHLLDCASKLHHVEAVNLVWNAQVVPSYLKPSTGTCLNVLNVAARIGNVKLATDVFRVLAERQTVFNVHHYELLLETYLNAKDLNAGLSVILIMQEGGIKVDEIAINPLFAYLNQDDSRPMEAFDILQSFEHSGRKVPTSAINVCIQASVHRGRLEEALEIYKALHTVSQAGPTTATFNILFQGCHRAGRKELAMFLASEMIQLGVVPDALTYDRLVHVCLSVGDVEGAFQYYEEMRGQSYIPRRGMLEMLIEEGCEDGDARTPAVLKDMEAMGITPKRLHKTAVSARFAAAPSTGNEDALAA